MKRLFNWALLFLLSSLVSSVALASPEIVDLEQTQYETLDGMEVNDYDGDDPTFCRAVVILLDSKDSFKSESDAFNWCFDRVRGWNLDSSKGWRDRFCRVQRTQHKDDYGDKYYRWNSRFRHEDADFRSRYRGNIFQGIDQRYSARLFKGIGLNFQINFSRDCKYKG